MNGYCVSFDYFVCYFAGPLYLLKILQVDGLAGPLHLLKILQVDGLLFGFLLIWFFIAGLENGK